MAVFTPPVDMIVPAVTMDPAEAQANALGNRLFRHYGARARGRNVYRLVDGTVTETEPYPYVDASASLGVSAPTVAATFYGGHSHRVSASDAAALAAAGYTVTGNLLSDDDASFEGGICNWKALGRADAPTIGDPGPPYMDGVRALRVSVHQGGAFSGALLRVPFSPGVQATLRATVKGDPANTGDDSCFTALTWLDANGAQLAAPVGAASPATRGVPVDLSATATSPPGTAYLILDLRVAPIANEVFWWDEVALLLGTSTAWPGTGT